MNDRASIIIDFVLDCDVGTIVMRTKLAWMECYATPTELFMNAFLFFYRSKMLSQISVIAELRSFFC